MTKDQAIANVYAQGYNPNLKIELTDEKKLKDFLRNLSGLCDGYNGHHKNWLLTANTATTEEASNYFKAIGMSGDEMTNLKGAINRQHNLDELNSPNNKTLKDFAHEFVEITTNYNDSVGKVVPDIGTFGQTDEMASIKGDIWSGSMENGDLYANIDSMNIYNRVKKGNSRDFMKIVTDYNLSVVKGETDRGDEYCANYGNGDIEKGKQRIKDIVSNWNPGTELVKENNIKTEFKYSLEQSSEANILNSVIMSGDTSRVEAIIDDMQEKTRRFNDRVVSSTKQIDKSFTKFYNIVHIDIDNGEK